MGKRVSTQASKPIRKQSYLRELELVTLLGCQKGSQGLEGEATGTPGGIRTPNLLIRSQMLYPLSYGRKPYGASQY